MAGEEATFKSCKNHFDCPSRFKCYLSSASPYDGGKKECRCNKSMLYGGPECRQVDGFAVFTFCLTAYVMARCCHHSYCVFSVQYKKWKRETRSERKNRLSIPLPLTASTMVFLASSLYFFCCTLNMLRMFTAVYESLIFSQIIPFCFGLGTLFATLAANISGLFWGEIAVRQRQIERSSLSALSSTGSSLPSFKFTRFYCMMLSVVFTSLYIALNITYGPGVVSFMVSIISQFSTIIWCSTGAWLIQRELGKRQEGGSVQRVLSNIREAAFKILTHTVLSVMISSVYLICEEAISYEAVPSIVVHLLIILLYVNVSETVIAIGEYLAAALKVRSIPSWFVFARAQVCLCLLGCCSASERRVFLEEGGEEDRINRNHQQQRPAAGPTTARAAFLNIQNSTAVRSFLGFPSTHRVNFENRSLPSISEHQDGVFEVGDDDTSCSAQPETEIGSATSALKKKTLNGDTSRSNAYKKKIALCN